MFFLDTEEALDIAPAPLPNSGLLHPRRPGVKPTWPVGIEWSYKQYDLRYYLLNGKPSLDINNDMPVYQTTEGGDLVIDSSGNWVELRKNSTVLDGSSTATFFIDFIYQSGVHLFSRWAGSADVRRQFNVFLDSGTNRIVLVVASSADSGTWYGRYFDTTPLVSGHRYTMAVSVNGKNFICYINGILQSQSNWIDTAFTVFSTTPPASHPVHLGRSYDGSDAVIGRYKSFFVTNKLLPPVLLEKISRDPYQILKPKLDILPLQSRNVPGGFSLPTSVTRPRRPGQKPTWPVEVDWSHPLSNGLRLCVDMSDGAFTNMVNGEKPNIGSTPPALKPIGNRLAAEGQNSGNCYCEYTNPDLINLPASGNFTVFAQVYGTAYSTNNALVTWSGADDLLLYPLDVLHDQCRVFWRDVSGTLPEVISPPDGPLNKWVNYLLESRGDQEHKLRQNNILIAASTNSRSGAGPFNSFRLFNWKDDPPGQNYNDYVSLVLIWARALSEAEKAQLNEDPYQFLIPKL